MKLSTCVRLVAVILLTLFVIFPATADPLRDLKKPSSDQPARDPNQPVDEDYTKKIREYTTKPFFNSPLTDYLPLSPTVKGELKNGFVVYSLIFFV